MNVTMTQPSMMKAEIVSETLDINSILKRLIAREDFIPDKRMIRELQAYMTRPWPFSKRSHLEDL
jgi:hypothetical protein